MRAFWRLAAFAVCLSGVACGSNDSSPISPTQKKLTSVSVTVPLPAGYLQLNTTAQATVLGTFSDGTTSDVTSTCAGWSSDNFNVLTVVPNTGLVTVRGGGSATITTACQSIFGHVLVPVSVIPDQIFFASGIGDNVVDIPVYVKRIRIHGTYPGYSSNFIVYIAGHLVVNELLGVGWGATTFDGTYLINTGGTAEIKSSSGVSWTFTEVR